MGMDLDNRPSLIELLMQDDVWVDGNGVTHRVETMDLRHCRNVHALLLRNAASLVHSAEASAMAGPMLYGDVARDGFNGVLDELDQATMDPEAWVRQQPLMEALETRIYTSGGRFEERTFRTVAVTVRLKVGTTDSDDAVRRGLDQALRNTGYEYTMTLVPETG